MIFIAKQIKSNYMRQRFYLSVLSLGLLVVPLTPALADSTPLQEKYLRIFLKMNSAEQSEKQGDYPTALDYFKDCYAKLVQIHQQDPDWESALVIKRIEDCKAEIISLQSKVASMPTQPAPTPSPSPTSTPTPAPTPTTVSTTDVDSLPDDPAVLKKRLREVETALQSTQDNLKYTQAQVDTYRAQLETVNSQLKAIKSKQSVNDRLGKLLDENKDLTTKLAAAQKEIDGFKTNPKSKLAMVQAQLKNLQEQFDASQAANTTLQQTITSLQQHLDQVQSDLANANSQKGAANGPGSAEYATVKHENELMRGILQRELQEQARRDEAKRLAQEEFDNLKIKSSKLQEQLDTLGEPMTPATTDEERTLLGSLKTSGMDVTPPATNGAGFSASTNAAPTGVVDTSTNAAPATTPAPSGTDTNSAPAVVTPTPPPPPPTADNSTNTPPTTVAINNPPPSTATPPAPPTTPSTDTNSAPPSTTATPPSTPDSTPTVGPVPPNTPSTPPPSTDTTATNTPPTTPPTSDTPTVTQVPQGTTTVTDTTITHSDNANTNQPPDVTQYSTKARLPEDMRDTAQMAADLFKMQKYDEAAAKYQTIIDKYPESLYAWSNLGVVRFQQGDLTDALKALQQAVKLSPTDAFSYSNLGIVYYQLNQYENAIDALNAAKALDPNDPKTRNYLGCACSRKGWQEVAEKEFRKAIELDPNFGDAHFNLALVYATEKPPQIELAKREYNRALELGIAKEASLEKLLKQ